MVTAAQKRPLDGISPALSKDFSIVARRRIAIGFLKPIRLLVGFGGLRGVCFNNYTRLIPCVDVQFSVSFICITLFAIVLRAKVRLPLPLTTTQSLELSEKTRG